MMSIIKSLWKMLMFCFLSDEGIKGDRISFMKKALFDRYKMIL